MVAFLIFLIFIFVPRGIWDLSSQSGVEPTCPQQWKPGVLTTGPAGKSWNSTFWTKIKSLSLGMKFRLSCLGSSHLATEITQILILKIWSQVFKTSGLKWHRGCHSPCSLPLASGSTWRHGTPCQDWMQKSLPSLVAGLPGYTIQSFPPPRQLVLIVRAALESAHRF